MKKILPLLFTVLVAVSCQPDSVTPINTVIGLKGDMLFEGANSLTAPSNTSLDAMAGEAQVAPEKITSVGVSKALIILNPAQRAITESLLLQMVSDTQEMITVGTLSPLPDGTTFELQLAEEIDLLPYLTDTGATWVLDLNLNEDFLDLMEVEAQITLDVNYKS